MRSEQTPRKVLVCDAHTIGAIAVIRSLGRSGYKAVAYSADPKALGLQSRYTNKALIAPPYQPGDEFLEWLRSTISANRISCIIPSETLMLAIRDDFDEFRHLLPLPSESTSVYRGLSKFDLFKHFENAHDELLRKHLPPFRLLEESSWAIHPWTPRYPVYVKTDAVHSYDGSTGNVVCANNRDDLEVVLADTRAHHSKALLQQHVPGVGVGCFLLRWNGKVYAHFMHRRLHEVPHTGGASSYRESWWHERIFDDSLARLESLNWQGVGMFEYRWLKDSDEFWLMEFNSRFWGSLHLALYAGVDFPALLTDAFYGSPRESMAWKEGIKCRLTFPKEVQYVWSRVSDNALPLSDKLRSIEEFVRLGLDPRVRSDLLYPGDRWLYAKGLWRSIAYLLK
jgi:predicted ATP-grasp superfamily ATP-dependent carboligase